MSSCQNQTTPDIENIMHALGNSIVWEIVIPLTLSQRVVTGYLSFELINPEVEKSNLPNLD